MAKSSRGGRRGGASISQSHTGVQVTNQAVVNTGVRNYTNMTDTDAQKLRDDVDSRYDPDIVDAIKLYISDSNPNGDGFSHSQNLNYKMDNGKPLNATEKLMISLFSNSSLTLSSTFTSFLSFLLCSLI